MYKLHLIRKYLLKRRIAWVALLAVMLCTTMVLVVFSVMNGWLETFQNSFHAMTSDVVVEASSELVGFPRYAEIAARAEREVPGVTAAEPVITSFGLINIDGYRMDMAHVVGYPPGIGRVNGWPDTLHRQAAALRAGKPPSFDLLPDVPYGRLVPPKQSKTAASLPGMIVSSSVVGIYHGDQADAPEVRSAMVQRPVTLTLLQVAPDEAVTADSAHTFGFWIVDDAKSRVYQLDGQNVYVGFDELQRDLGMDEQPGKPARCTELQIKAKPGYDLNVVRDGVAKVAREVEASHPLDPYYGFSVETWQVQQGDFITAVKHEVVITTLLFGVISLVAVLLIFCIFYMIVVEKTKDIGVIKSVGATGGGILALFLGYGLTIGVIGAAAGTGLAVLIVRNINELHAWLGRVTAGQVQIWSPKTYQFDRIPSKIEGATIAWTVGVALLAAVLGALLPAVRAAGMNPVDSLRYE